jgi:hypothetical protein
MLTIYKCLYIFGRQGEHPRCSPALFALQNLKMYCAEATVVQPILSGNNQRNRSDYWSTNIRATDEQVDEMEDTDKLEHQPTCIASPLANTFFVNLRAWEGNVLL